MHFITFIYFLKDNYTAILGNPKVTIANLGANTYVGLHRKRKNRPFVFLVGVGIVVISHPKDRLLLNIAVKTHLLERVVIWLPAVL